MTVERSHAPATRESFGHFASKFAKTLASALLPGAISGFFAFGLGSRLAMRVMAATSGPEAQGLRTEADEIVGRITFEGSMFLIVAGTVIGAGAGLVYLVIKPWLPKQRWKRTAIFCAVMLALVGRTLVDSNNRDFDILSPAALAVAMFTVMPLLYGALFVQLYDRIEPFMMKQRSRWVNVGLVVPCLLPLALGGPVSLVLLPLLMLMGWTLSGSSPIRGNRSGQMVGRALLGGGVAVGITLIAISVVEIL
ncbi:MAG: hypothetical protein QOK47_414 [Actinomycetota bacterium]|nr:hypothetical protein [Actinomycetota bacterium]